MKPTVPDTQIRPLNDQHDQNVADKPVTHNLLHAFNIL